MRGHKGYHHTHGTAEKISKHIAKHRARGGRAEDWVDESPRYGVDEAGADLRDNPERRTHSKINDEAEAMHAKRGGKAKKHVGKASGGEAMHHAGRRRRASGGAAENHPFTTAHKGTLARGRKVEYMSEGSDSE